jgi:proteasome lid subunit RPN8/RPN11
MTITRGAAEAIRAAAEAAVPAECCGLLLGTADAIVQAWPARNTASEPVRRYDVDPADHVAAVREARRRGLSVVGAYHSHPRMSPAPSATDLAEALPDFLYLIAGRETAEAGWALRAFRLEAREPNFAEVVLVSSE